MRLTPQEEYEMKFYPCLRSGFCCKQGVCPFGEWDAELHQCKFLEGDEIGEHYCGKYEEIQTKPFSNVSPAFGAGCSSASNPDRLLLIKRSK